MHFFVKLVKGLLLWDHVQVAPGCLQRLLGESSVTLHTCKEEGGVHPVQVKRRDDRFPSQPENRFNVSSETHTEQIFFFSTTVRLCLLLVSDVAGVVDPHQLTETLTPPRGQMQSHVEAVFSLRRWVPPAEPIPLKLGRFLLTNNAVHKLSHKLTAQLFYFKD